MRPHRPTDLPPFGSTKFPVRHKNPLLDLRTTDLRVENIRGFRIVIYSIKIQIIVKRPSTIRSRSRSREIRINLNLSSGGLRFVFRVMSRGAQFQILFIRTEFPLEPEIGILEKNAGMVQAWTTDGELKKRSPAAGGNRVADDKIGDKRRDGLITLVLPADITDCRGESGGNTSQTSPVTGIVFELEEDVEKNVVGEGGEEGFRHCWKWGMGKGNRGFWMAYRDVRERERDWDGEGIGGGSGRLSCRCLYSPFASTHRPLVLRPHK